MLSSVGTSICKAVPQPMMIRRLVRWWIIELKQILSSHVQKDRNHENSSYCFSCVSQIAQPTAGLNTERRLLLLVQMSGQEANILGVPF